MKLSIIIVNFNGKHFFDECLRSISLAVQFEHEIIVVDNASSDGSVEYIQTHFPQVKLVVSKANLGFAGGNNLGAKLAQGQYLLLLNNDTVLLDDLEPVIRLMDSSPTIGVLGARMVGRDQEYRYSAGYFPEPWRLLKFSSLFKKDEGFKSGIFPENIDCCDVDWVEGSFLLTPRSVWERLSGLDESYFMYVEDVDYAKRATDLGLHVVYFTKLTYVHFGGSGQARVGLVSNGFRRFHRRHSGVVKKAMANLLLDLGLCVRAFVYAALSVVDRKHLSRAVLYFKALRRD